MENQNLPGSPPPITPAQPTVTTTSPPPALPVAAPADVAQAIADINAVGTLPLPEAAADTDNIEPEWVDKAKQIVRTSLDDPFRQVQELHQLRVDYMKKRYNKDLSQPAA